jgi:hypothetical protein
MAKRKTQIAEAKTQERLSWIIAVLDLALTFAFCDLPFDLLFALASGSAA